MNNSDVILKRTNFDDMNLPPILYKYRDWEEETENHKKVLTEKELYFASPADFTDKHDCKIPICYDLLTDKEIYEKYFEMSKRDNSRFTQQQHQEFAIEWQKRGLMRDKKHLEEMKKEFSEKFNKDFGILSLTAVPDNYEMWNSEYANFKKGFCVGFSAKPLFEFSRDFGGSGGKVNYCKDLPIIKGIENPIIQYCLQIYSKLEKYKDEKEYRIAKGNIQNRKVKIPSEIFAEIIIGEKMPAEIQNEIIKLAKKDFPNVTISKASFNNNKVKINKI